MAETIGARTLRELSRVIFARLGTVAAIVALLIGGTLIACLIADKHYSSSVKFLVREPKPQNPTAQPVTTDRSLEVFVKTQHELIKSQTVLARTVVLLDAPESQVAQDWQDAGAAWKENGSEQNWQRLKAALKQLTDEAGLRMNDPATGGDFREKIRDFARKVKVETPGGEEVALTEIFTLTVTLPGTPEHAQKAARLLGESYEDRYREVQVESSQNAAELMRQRRDALKQDRLGPAEQALREFVQGLESPSDLVILEQLARAGTEAGRQIIVRRFEEEMILTGSDLAEAKQLKLQLLEQLPPALWGDRPPRDEQGDLTVPDAAQLDEKRLPENSPILTETITIIPEDTLKNNVVVSQLKKKEVDLIIELNRLKVEYKQDYRGIQDKLTEIAQARRQILKELIGEARALDIKIATLSARRQEIGRRLAEEQRKLDTLTPQLVRHQELQNEVAMAREEYRKVSGDLTAAIDFQEQEENAITINILDPAKLPDVDEPAFPRTFLYTLVATAVGLLLAVAYAFLADYFDHTLRSIEETERYLGVPVVGSIGKYPSGILQVSQP